MEFGAVGCKVGAKLEEFGAPTAFVFAVISERTMARGRKKKFSDYIRTEVARIYRLLHNVGTLRRGAYFFILGAFS